MAPRADGSGSNGTVGAVARAQWTTKNQEIVAGVDADGMWSVVVPLYDNNVKALTFTLKITADRALRLEVHGEPGAALTGFEAWSDF